MGSKSSDAPPEPDPAALADAQAKANRVSVFSPFGNLIYGKTTPGTYPSLGSNFGVPAFPDFSEFERRAPTPAGGDVLRPQPVRSPAPPPAPIANPEIARLKAQLADIPQTITGPGRNVIHAGYIPGRERPNAAYTDLEARIAGLAPTIAGPGAAAGAPLAEGGFPAGFTPFAGEGEDALDNAVFQQMTPNQIAAGRAAEFAKMLLAEQLSGRIGELPTGPLDPEGRISGSGGEVEEATFGRFRGLLDPVFEQGEGRLRERLRNAGHVAGGEGYDAEFDTFNRGRERAYGDAAQAAVGAGRAEQSRMLAAMLAERQAPFNEALALLGVPMVPTQVGGGGVPPIDVVGPAQLAQNAQIARMNQGQARRSDLMGGLFGLGSAAVMASDRTLKTDIERIGELPSGLGVYRWAWNETARRLGIGGPTMGVIAQEVEAVMPWLVSTLPSGHLAVNYAGLR